MPPRRRPRCCSTSTSRDCSGPLGTSAPSGRCGSPGRTPSSVDPPTPATSHGVLLLPTARDPWGAPVRRHPLGNRRGPPCPRQPPSARSPRALRDHEGVRAQSEETSGQPVVGTGGSPWWHTAVVYQVYIRSFQDSDGDGIGDIGGLCERVAYLAVLGVDALWI